MKSKARPVKCDRALVLLLAHDPPGRARGMLFGKPLHTIPDHALTDATRSVGSVGAKKAPGRPGLGVAGRVSSVAGRARSSTPAAEPVVDPQGDHVHVLVDPIDFRRFPCPGVKRILCAQAGIPRTKMATPNEQIVWDSKHLRRWCGRAST
jgi:hypothetical protein